MHLASEWPKAPYGDWSRWLAILQDMYHFDASGSDELLQGLERSGLLTAGECSACARHWDGLHENSLPPAHKVAMLHELAFQMDMNLEERANSAFLTRLYRFREVLVLYLISLADPDYDPSHDYGHGDELTGRLFKHYRAGELKGYEGAYFFLHSRQLADTIRLRNHSIVGHGRVGVSSVTLWHEYEGYPRYEAGDHAQRFLADMVILFNDLRRPLIHNPYRLIAQRFYEKIEAEIARGPIGAGSYIGKTLFEGYLTDFHYRAMVELMQQGGLPRRLENPLGVARRLLWGNVNEQDTDAVIAQIRRLQSKRFSGVSLAEIRGSWARLASGEQRAVISLLFYQMKAFAHMGDYGEWITRVYRMAEELLMVYVGYDYNTETHQPTCKAGSHVEGHVNQEHGSPQCLMLHRLYPVSVKCHESRSEAFILLENQWVPGLIRLRSHGFSGHGDKALTPRAIGENWRSVDRVEDDLREAMAQLGLALERDWFADLHAIIQDVYSDATQVSSSQPTDRAN